MNKRANFMRRNSVGFRKKNGFFLLNTNLLHTVHTAGVVGEYLSRNGQKTLTCKAVAK